MNKLKKILSVVLSIGLVASTLVLPITAEAATTDDVNCFYNYTFDDAAHATGVFGTGDMYEVVDGTNPTAVHASATNRDAADKLAKLSATNYGTLADGTEGSYLFGSNWGGAINATHATLQFDVQFTNTYNKFTVYPAGNGNDGNTYRYGFEMEEGPDAAKPIEALHNTWDNATSIATLDRLKWHQFAIEYDMANGVAKLYLDGAVIDTWDGLSGTKVPTDFKFKMETGSGGNCVGNIFIDDLFYYEGAYQNVTPAVAPLMDLDMEDSADITRFGGTQVAGLAGKLATDKVASHSSASTRDYVAVTSTSDTMTYEASIYVPSGNNAQLHVFNAGSCSGRMAIQLRADGTVVTSTANHVSGLTSIWTELNDTSLTHGTYNTNTWNKVAMELNNTAKTIKFYVNGTVIRTVNIDTTYDQFSRDLAFTNSGSFYADNVRVYEGAYKADDAITVTGATGNKVPQAASIDAIKAYAAGNDRVVVYADAALTTEATTVSDANYLLVQNDELYAVYEIVSPYGTKYRWYDFSTTTDITNVSNVAGIMGKDATDMVGTFTGGGASYNWGSWYTDEVITVEAQVYAGSNKAEIYAGSNYDGEDRPGVYIQNGKFGYVKANGWVYTEICDVDKDMWHKVAYEMHPATGEVKYYLDGELKQTVTMTLNAAKGTTQDIRAQHTGGYIDNFHVYAASYVADAPITVASTAAVTVSGTTLTATEGTTLAQLAETVTAGTAKFYTDTTLATETTNVSTANVMLVNNGDLYKKYDVNITSPYGEKYREYDFTSSTDITNGAIVNGLAGKAASDKVFNVNAGGASYNWGLWYASKVVTIEAQILAGANKIEIYTGSNHDGEDRPGLYVQNGKVGYVNANGWVYTDAADIDSTIWNKVALTMDANNGNAKLYLNGELIGTYNVAYNSNGINQDIRVQNNGYIDNFRVYGAAYVADETIATPSAVADGTFVVANGQTLAEAAAAVTDGTATFYTDNTYSTEATLANVGYVLINKGELYKAYPVKVASKYDGALLSTNFNAGSIDYAGDFAGNGTGSWYNVGNSANAEVSYTQPGGKDSKAWTVKTTAYGKGNTVTNARLQTGWGSANAKYSAGVYTVEAQLYKTEAVSAGSIGIKMRNSAGANKIFQVYAPAVAHEWFKVALTVDTVNGTVAGYVNGEEADVLVDGVVVDSLTVDGSDYNIVSDQVNLTAADHQDIDVTTSGDNFRVYAGAYKGDTMPVIDEAVTMDAGATVADVIAETGADFVVTADGSVASNSALAETGMKAVAVNGECYAYCDVTATALIADVNFGTLATGTVYEKDGVEYVFVAVTTDTVNDFSLYETFACTDGVDTKGIALSELMGTTLTGAGQLGVLVMNVPAANAANFKAKLVLAD